MCLIRMMKIDRRVRPSKLPGYVLTLAVLTLSSYASPALSQSKHEIVEIATRGDFEALERRLTSLQEAFEADGSGEHRIDRAFNAFKTSDPALKKRLDQWVERYPNSYAALTARSVNQIHLGWLSRGTRSGWDTHPEQFAAMERYFDAAQRDLEAALELNDKIAKAYERLMEYELSFGRRMFGETFVSFVLEWLFGPESIFGRHAKLRRIYKNGLAVLPNSSSLHFSRLRSLDRNWGGSDRQVDEFFELAEREAPFNLGYREVSLWRDYYLANRAYNEDRDVEALRLIDKAIRAKDTVEASEKRARILWALGRQPEALRELRRGAELDPEQSDVRALMSRYLLAPPRRNENEEEALRQLDAALRRDPLHPRRLERRARLLLRLGRPDDAERDLENAFAFGRYEPRVHATKGQFFMARKNTRRASEAYRQARDLAPNEKWYWQQYERTLHELCDCEYLVVSVRYLEMCLKDGRCNEQSISAKTSYNQHFKQRNNCPQEIETAHLHSLFTASTDVRQIALSNVKLNAPIDVVLREFPDMKVEPKNHIGGPGVLHVHEGRYEPKNKSLHARATLSRDRRLVYFSTDRVFVLEESMEQIAARLVKTYGPPDQMRAGTHLEMIYKQADDTGQALARFEIRAKIVSAPIIKCRLPPHLRQGRTVARLTMHLIDVARQAENDKETTSRIREWNVNAIQLQNAEQERKMREIAARQQAFAANGC